MKPEEEAALVAKAIQNRPTDFEVRDVQPIRLRRQSPPSPIPPQRRTVFQPGTDWAASSTKTVLDALHSSYESQAKEWADSNDTLDLSRCSGSVAVDAKMADLFDTQVGKPTQEELLEPTVVQCKICRRPVLMTRFLEHRNYCAGASQGEQNMTNDSTCRDEQLDLIEAPYGQGGKADDASSTDTALPRDASPRTERRRSNFKRSAAEGGLNSPTDLDLNASIRCSFPPDEDDWESTLYSEAPRYIPRGFSAKRRRIPLPTPVESSAQRKRSQNAEKKALQAAAAAGIHPLPNQAKNGFGTKKSAQEDPITQLARELGDSAPWSKLMQIAMPVTLPRNPKVKKLATGREQSNASGMSSGNATSTAVSGDQNSKVKVSQSKDKAVTNLNVAPPSLVGALMWIRGQGMKELANTTLYNMDAPQAPIGRTGAIFHGQTYVAELGTFETDPRAQTTIKMPLAASAPPPISGKPASMAAPTPKGQVPTDTRGKKQQAPSNHVPGTPNGVVHQQVPKKQRNSKAQRAQLPGVGGQLQNGPIQGKPNQNSRKAGNPPRMQAPMAVGAKSATNSYDSQHRGTVIRNANPIGASNATSAALSNASAAAAKYASQQLAQQKKGFRPASAPEGIGVPSRVGQSLPTAAGTVTGLHLTSKPMSRVGKARQIPAQVGGTPQLNRVPSGKIVKSPSPSHASSRSGERLPLHRGSPASAAQNDPNLMASSMIAATTALNRAANVRGVSGKGQIDFQQAIAQAAAAGRENPTATGSRGLLQHGATDGQIPAAEKFNAAMQRSNIRGVLPPGRVKYPGPVYTMPAGPKGTSRPQARMPAQKDDQLQQKTADLEAQLRRTEPLGTALLGGKAGNAGHPIDFANRADRTNVAHNQIGNPLSQNVYSSALAAASAQHASNAALNNQPNMGLFPMPHASQNNVAPAGAAGATPNMLQNLHDMRALQNMGLMPGIQAGGHNANVLGFLPPGLSAGMPQTGAANSGVGAGIPAGAIPSAPNPGVLARDAILQQLLAGRGGALAPNAPTLAGQAINPVAAQLGHAQAHQMGRAAPTPPVPRPVIQSNAIDEIDRALGLSFDESDLQD